MSVNLPSIENQFLPPIQNLGMVSLCSSFPYLLGTIYCFKPLDSRSKDLWNDEDGTCFVSALLAFAIHYLLATFPCSS